MSRDAWRWVGRGAAATAFVLAGLPLAASAQEADSPPPFAATAAAGGVKVTLTIPSFPISDTPVNGGGPTAQAVADSLGGSQGYAALPDPGQFVTGLPSLVTGLVKGGAAGLPPIDIPSLPDYPLYVQSDAGNPKRSIGAGPYRLSAESNAGATTADAVGGLQLDAAGNVALVSSSASVSSTSNAVEVRASSDIQGIAIGPLSLGRVTSTVSQTMDDAGTVTPSSSFKAEAVSIGGVSIGLGPEGLDLGVASIPLPINATLNQLLSGAGISMRVLPAVTEGASIVGATLEISAPVTIPSLGTGRMTLSIGAVSASITGAAPSDPISDGADLSGAPDSLDGGSTGVFDAPSTDAAFGLPPSLGPAAPSGQSAGVAPVAQVGLVGRFDLRSLYLVLAGLALTLLTSAHTIKVGGNRD